MSCSDVHLGRYNWAKYDGSPERRPFCEYYLRFHLEQSFNLYLYFRMSIGLLISVTKLMAGHGDMARRTKFTSFIFLLSTPPTSSCAGI